MEKKVSIRIYERDEEKCRAALDEKRMKMENKKREYGRKSD